MATSSGSIVINELVKHLGMTLKWRVDWIEEPRKPELHHTQHMMWVYFSPLRDGYEGQITLPEAADSDRQVPVELGVGYLPVIHKGAVFYQGSRLDRSLKQILTEKFRLSPADFCFHDMGGGVGYRGVVQSTYFKVGPKAYSRAQKSKILIVSDAERTDASFVAIPSIEIARFFFCLSSLLSRHLCSSGWDDLILWSQCNTEDLPRSVVVGLRTVAGLDEKSTPYLAYAVVDKLTQECLSRIHQSLQSTFRRDSPALECRLPVNTPIEIEAEVIRIPADTEKGYRYFVTRLLKCERPQLFEGCQTWPQLHRGQGKNKDDPDLKPMNLVAQQGATSPELGAPLTHIISNLEELAENATTSDEFGRPLQSSEAVEFPILESRFPGLDGMKAPLAEKEFQKYRNESKSPIVLPVEGRTSSTGRPGGANPVARGELQISDLHFEDRGLQLLKDSTSYIAGFGYGVKELPVLKLHKFSSGGARWTRIQIGQDFNGAKIYRSRLLLALLILGQRGHCIVGEIEIHPGEDDSKRRYMAGFKFHNLDNLSELLQAIAKLVAERRGWPEYDADKRVFDVDGAKQRGERVRHLNIETAEALATRVRDSILIELGV